MSSEAFQLLAMGALLLAEAYAVAPWRFPVVAWSWDKIAKICNMIANAMWKMAIAARANYWEAI